MQHVAIEYDLTEAVRPELVVDLGAGDCVSFFTYCQSMTEHDIAGSCYAIDEWQDHRAPRHPASSFEAVNAHGRRFYSGLCYLVRMSPPEARKQFEEKTIDLLRIDGTRSEVVAAIDIEAWFRRVRPGGIIIWHGDTKPSSPWSLIASRAPSAVFSTGRGLGLALRPGIERREELLQLLFANRSVAPLEQFYAHAKEHLGLRRVVEAML